MRWGWGKKMSIVKNFDSMLKQQHYNDLSNEFKTDIGIAEWESPFYGYHTNVRKIPDNVKVAILTNHIIKEGIYQQVIKEVIRLEKKYKNKRINTSTIYEKAINNII
jgi:hypothetical protein